jgi:release factor glutamine methyltransferase
LDLGTGTGAIALAIAQKIPEAKVVAGERSAAALALAAENAAAAGLAARVEFVASDWYAQIPPAAFDVIVSNPPYLSAVEVAETAIEVREFEPCEALAAEDGGCKDLEIVINGAQRFLRRGGLLALETGIAQHPRLVDLLSRLGFSGVESKPDLTGRDRFILAVW